ncbi:hypothetical protein J45TS6_12090 [Paenibacillus sp. J45TS6]|uniref:hypothetical protein n=1 Tax=Paenibacillus sp. J45TS6 TaxID=2807196 RepID=UPI001B2197DE|nr:hypothetical protein [Paenibacillus sp. J45TS6]GIP42750.1 hypothetical protein J45TS6_12090 [Paenibacillus sp. J45TS6]
MTNLSIQHISEKALRRMAWGFTLLILDINIMNFDIFNDLLGYVLILYSLSSLEAESALFQKVKWITFILLIESFIRDWVPNLNSGIWFPDISLSSIVYAQSSSIVNLLMIMLLFTSLGQLSIWHQMSDPSLEEAILTRRNALIGLLVLQQFFYPFIINLEKEWAIVMTIYAVLYVFFMFLLIRLLFRLAKAYQGVHQEQ